MDIQQLRKVLARQARNKNHASKHQNNSQLQQSRKYDIDEIQLELSLNSLSKSRSEAQPPQFLLQILRNQEKSGLVIRQASETISKMRKNRQRIVYLSYSQSQFDYLQQLHQMVVRDEKFTKQVTKMLTQRAQKVENELQSGRIIINHDRAAITSKDQIEQMVEIDRARLLQIKQGAIRSKLDLLNSKMKQVQLLNNPPPKIDVESINELYRKVEENIAHHNYALDSERTKIARDYVRFMEEQKKEQIQKKKQREQKRRRQEEARQQELKENQQMKNLAMKQEKVQKILQQKKKKEEQQKQLALKQEQIEKFMSQYRNSMPIFQRKIKEFHQKVLIPQRIYRQQKLRQLRQRKKSHSLHEIIGHQKKYEELKMKEKERKEIEKEMQQRALSQNNKKYFKGRMHIVLQQRTKQQEQKIVKLKQEKKRKFQKMIGYAKEVKELYRPKIDESKREQILNILQMERKKNSKYRRRYRQVVNSEGEEMIESFYEQKPEKNLYQEGNSFMYQGNLRRKKMQSQSEQSTHTKQQQGKKPQRYSHRQLNTQQPIIVQKQKWKLKSKQIKQITNNVQNKQDFEHLKTKLQSLDKQVVQQEKKLKNLDLGEQIEKKQALEQFYLQTIKNKIKILQ